MTVTGIEPQTNYRSLSPLGTTHLTRSHPVSPESLRAPGAQSHSLRRPGLPLLKSQWRRFQRLAVGLRQRLAASRCATRRTRSGHVTTSGSTGGFVCDATVQVSTAATTGHYNTTTTPHTGSDLSFKLPKAGCGHSPDEVVRNRATMQKNRFQSHIWAIRMQQTCAWSSTPLRRRSSPDFRPTTGGATPVAFGLGAWSI